MPAFEFIVNAKTSPVLSKLEDIRQRFPELLAGAMYREAESLMTAIKREHVPVDFGMLRASGHVAPPVITPTNVSVTMGFGGVAGAGNLGHETNTKDVGYAAVVHENPRAGKTGGWGPKGPTETIFRWIKGKVRPIGAQRTHYATTGAWKFLERPFLARSSTMAARIGKRVLFLLGDTGNGGGGNDAA